MMRHLQRLPCVAVLLALSLFPRGSDAASRRGRGASAQAVKQSLVNKATAQLQAAENLLATANAKGGIASAEVSQALGKLQSAKQQFDTARHEIAELAKQLREIEREILAEQTADSPYTQAKLKLENARRDLATLETQLLKAADYDDKKAGLASGSDVLKLKQQILDGSSEYQLAKSMADAAAITFSSIRSDLLRGDDDWRQTNEALGAAHKEEEHAQDRANSAGVARLAPVKDVRDANQVAAYARAAAAQAQATLTSLGVKSTSSSSNSNKRK